MKAGKAGDRGWNRPLSEVAWGIWGTFLRTDSRTDTNSAQGTSHSAERRVSCTNTETRAPKMSALEALTYALCVLAQIETAYIDEEAIPGDTRHLKSLALSFRAHLQALQKLDTVSEDNQAAVVALPGVLEDVSAFLRIRQLASPQRMEKEFKDLTSRLETARNKLLLAIRSNQPCDIESLVLKALDAEEAGRDLKAEGRDSECKKAPDTSSDEAEDNGAKGAPNWLDWFSSFWRPGTLDATPRAAATELRKAERKADVEKILEVMQAHSMDVNVQYTGLGSITHLAESDALRARLTSEGADQVILAAMTAHRSEASVQHGGLAAVRNLLGDSDASQERLVQLGVCEIVVAAMTRHGVDANVQESGCRLIRNLATGSQPRKLRLLSTGAGEVLVAAMAAHPLDANVQTHGCAAIRNLAFESDAIREPLMTLGAGKVVVAAMEGHRMDSRVQYGGCGAIRYLATGSDIRRDQLLSTGAREVVEAAIVAHARDLNVQFDGHAAIETLRRPDDDDDR